MDVQTYAVRLPRDLILTTEWMHAKHQPVVIVSDDKAKLAGVARSVRGIVIEYTGDEETVAFDDWLTQRH